jgi:hypothetical protein
MGEGRPGFLRVAMAGKTSLIGFRTGANGESVRFRNLPH